ncbi:MAG: ester cyclase [Bacteroidetes bacterium]|nr:ester cyclase [Bacteroidota bacterium]
MTNISKPIVATCIGIAISFCSVAKSFHSDSPTIKTDNQTMGTTQTASNKEAIRTLYTELLNHRHLDQLGTVIDDSYVGIQGEKGPEGFKETVGSIISAFSDIQWNIDDLIADGNKVVVRWTWTGTFKHPFRGFSPTQKQLSNSAIGIYEFANGKAVHAWLQSDQLGFLMQIGVITPTIFNPTKK